MRVLWIIDHKDYMIIDQDQGSIKIDHVGYRKVDHEGSMDNRS